MPYIESYGNHVQLLGIRHTYIYIYIYMHTIRRHAFVCMFVVVTGSGLGYGATLKCVSQEILPDLSVMTNLEDLLLDQNRLQEIPSEASTGCSFS